MTILWLLRVTVKSRSALTDNTGASIKSLNIMQCEYNKGKLNKRGSDRRCKREAEKKTSSGKNYCLVCYSRWWRKQKRKNTSKWTKYQKRRESTKRSNQEKKRYKKFIINKAKELKRKPTGAEAIFERKIKELGYKYIFQWHYVYEDIGGICDFYLPDYKLCVEIDGGYHLEEDQKQTDRIKDFIYVKMGKKVLRMTNSQAMYMKGETLKALIEEFNNKEALLFEDSQHLRSMQLANIT